MIAPPVGAPAADGCEDLDVERLSSWLAANVNGFAGPTDCIRFAGGRSNPTYRLDTPSRRYVLRRKPRGALLPSAHAVDREFRVLSALSSGDFPVPRPMVLCDDDTVIGSMFYVMEMVEGISISDAALPQLDAVARRSAYHAMIDTLSRLHNLDHEALSLADFGKTGNYFERQIARWSRQYRSSETETIEAIDRLIDWLPKTVPPQARISLVHGDFRVDNLIFDATGSSVEAVLDWELSTIGDPLADTSYFLMNWVMPPEGRWGVLGLTGEDTGIPPLTEMVDRYCAATQRHGLPLLEWYFAYNMFRVACIAQGVRRRALDGIPARPQTEDASARILRLATTAWGFAEAAGA